MQTFTEQTTADLKAILEVLEQRIFELDAGGTQGADEAAKLRRLQEKATALI